jgi:uncharacterized protein (TIGR02453 family)
MQPRFFGSTFLSKKVVKEEREMKNVISFLSLLAVNNNRDWFEANRGWYEAALGEFNEFAGRLIGGIGDFDVATRGLGVRDCTYRIYRDVRFSPDKRPYKGWMGCYVCPGGKKSGMAGYYFHVEPRTESGGAAYFLTAGLYMPEGNVLRSVRSEIVDNSEGFLESVARARGFFVNEERKLTRPPKGFPAGTPVDDYLKLKDICLEQPMDEATLLRGDVAEWAAGEFRKTCPFVSLLNKAVEWAKEEM